MYEKEDQSMPWTNTMRTKLVQPALEARFQYEENMLNNMSKQYEAFIELHRKEQVPKYL